MSNIAIHVENLGKRYAIGRIISRHDTLRDQVALAMSAPLRRLRRTAAANAYAPPDAIWALRGMSLEIERGQVVGLIGRNGAGKSTLLKILSRITKPTEGLADIYGRVGTLLEVGTGFHPELTGRENIYLNGAILGMRRSEIQRQFDEIVAFSEVDRFIDTPVKHYSSGMYVRLAFAVAAHLETEILLVDEVLAVGDVAFQRKCLGKIGAVAKSGRTVLFVSHNMSAISEMCSVAHLIKGGRIQKSGTPSEVIPDYLGDAVDSDEGVFDYTHHPARNPHCRSLIKKVVLRTPHGQSSSVFYSGDPLQIEIWIEPEAPIHQPRIAFSIEDPLGRRIGTAGSYLNEQSLGDVDGACRIICTIPSLPLGSGRYLIGVNIATKYDGLMDSIDGGAWFELLWKNNYGNGEPFEPYYGPLLLQASWTCET